MKTKLMLKHKILQNCRAVLEKESFIETNTPVLRKGTNFLSKRPLVVFNEPMFNNTTAFMRDCPAVAMRPLLQYSPKLFEIGPSFRMDPIDKTHYPEFIMLEVVAANKSINYFMDLAKEIIALCYDKELNFNIISIKDYFFEKLDIDISSKNGDEIKDAIIKSSFDEYKKLEDSPDYEVINCFISENLETKPGINFLTDYPACTISGAKRINNSSIIYRFELFINGIEVAHSYLDEDDIEDFITRSKKVNLFNFEEQTIVELMKNNQLPKVSGELSIGIDRLCSAIQEVNIEHFVFTKEIGFLG